MSINPRIPLAPLEAAVAHAGGVSNLPGLSGFRYDIPADFPPYFQEVIERDASEMRQFERIRKSLRRARQEGGGTIQMHVADMICCEGLLVHPGTIYGQDWYTFVEKAQQARRASAQAVAA